MEPIPEEPLEEEPTPVDEPEPITEEPEPTAEEALTEEQERHEAEEEETPEQPLVDIEQPVEEAEPTETLHFNLMPNTPAVFTFPLSNHTVDSLKNLVFMIYTRGKLLSKSTRGDFYVSTDLVKMLQSGMIMKKEQALEIVENAGPANLRGLSFTSDTVTFTGFPHIDDPAVNAAWAALASAMNNAALNQKYVQPKLIETENEKFSLRMWLLRVGMGGQEMKKIRSILYRDLEGDTAFRTPADAERWKQRQKERRKMVRASLIG
jgi:hypothetical protein